MLDLMSVLMRVLYTLMIIVSEVSFESEGPKFLMEFHPHMCVLMLLIRNSAKVRHNSNPTRRLLVQICPRCCL